MSNAKEEIFPLESSAGICSDEILCVRVGTTYKDCSRYLLHRRLIALQSPEWERTSELDVDHYNYLKFEIEDVEAFDQVFQWVYHQSINTPRRDSDGQVSSRDLVLLLRTVVMAHHLSMWNLCAHTMDLFVHASAFDDFAHGDEVFDYVYSDECDIPEIKACVADAAIYNMWLDGGVSRHFEVGEMYVEHERNIARRLRENDTFDLVEDNGRGEGKVWSPLFARSCSYHPHEHLCCDQCPEMGLTVEQSYDHRRYRNIREWAPEPSATLGG